MSKFQIFISPPLKSFHISGNWSDFILSNDDRLDGRFAAVVSLCKVRSLSVLNGISTELTFEHQPLLSSIFPLFFETLFAIPVFNSVFNSVGDSFFLEYAHRTAGQGAARTARRHSPPRIFRWEFEKSLTFSLWTQYSAIKALPKVSTDSGTFKEASDRETRDRKKVPVSETFEFTAHVWKKAESFSSKKINKSSESHAPREHTPASISVLQKRRRYLSLSLSPNSSLTKKNKSARCDGAFVVPSHGVPFSPYVLALTL